MEKYKAKSMIAANFLAVTAFTGCAYESYHTDPSDVRCDDGQTMSDLGGDGVATFIVHGAESQDPATVTVRRENDEVSVKVEGNVTGPPQQIEADDFTEPTPLVEGAELSAFGAGGAWIIDAREDSVVIRGTCEGM